MAETMARCRGIGVLPQDMDLATVGRIIRHIKQANPVYDTPLMVTGDATLRDVQGIILKRAHDMVVVVDHDQKPLGIITHADLREKDQYTPAAELMQTRLVTIEAGISNRDAFIEMEKERVKAAPVVNQSGEVVGVLTRDDAVRMELLSPSLNSKGELMVAAAVGISAQAGEQAASLLEMGVDVLVLDTAHGYQRRMIEASKRCEKWLVPTSLSSRVTFVPLKARGRSLRPEPISSKLMWVPARCVPPECKRAWGDLLSHRCKPVPKRQKNLVNMFGRWGRSSWARRCTLPRCGSESSHGWHHHGWHLRKPGRYQRGQRRISL